MPRPGRCDGSAPYAREHSRRAAATLTAPSAARCALRGERAPGRARARSGRSAPATSAAASFSRVPSATRSSTCATASGNATSRAARRPPRRPRSRRARRGSAHGDQLGQRAARDLLVELGELAADRRAAIGAEGPGHVGEGCREPGGRLEEDQRARLARERARAPRGAPPACAAGSPRSAKRSVGRPETASAVSTALGPGIAVTVTPAAAAAATRPKPGVADGRHPGVAESSRRPGRGRARRARRPAASRCGRAGRSGAADWRRRGREEPLRGAGVLGRDDGGGLERLDQAARRVAEVADGGRREDDHAPSLGLRP